MKKFAVLFVIALFGLGISTATAQYEKGQIDLNIGAGLGASFGTGTGSLPPLSLSLDFGINDNISLGAYAGYYGTTFASIGSDWTYTYILLGARGAYHHQFVESLDTYAGALLGYNMASVDYGGAAPAITPNIGGIIYAGFVGARYHFGNSFGLFGEVGYGISYLTLGVTLKL
jgi:hypothetical protein